MQFSIFYGGSKSTKPEPKPITLGELIQLIKFDESLKDQVKIAQSFKQSGNKEEYNKAIETYKEQSAVYIKQSEEYNRQLAESNKQAEERQRQVDEYKQLIEEYKVRVKAYEEQQAE